MTSKPETTYETSLNSYLGQKGYTILKKELTPEQCVQIKKDLVAKPLTQSAPGLGPPPITFPVYRESPNKFYVPRYYGEQKFGKPKSIQIPEGDPINLTFSGSLRENQIPVVETYLAHVNTSQCGGGGLLELFCGFGKTCLALYICAKLKKKTLIIVHKEFLLNQWVERISEFLPAAKVGRIQGQVIDIEDKDIVIGMLQSLSMKDYPDTMFSSFGLTIIDEVHHISSEVFSQALFKIVTLYTLGLSATMERKDGTTSIFKMFLGNILYKSKREEDQCVVVKGIEYISNDPEFNEVPTDWRGNAWTPESDSPAAHPDARFTAPAAQCPSIGSEWQDPAGVPISAVLFGGRRRTTVPLVTEAFNWQHGVFLGSIMASETTAAQAGAVGNLRFDPMAMLPFCGYNMADYFAHWLKIGNSTDASKLPKIFFVNWFRRDEDGRFLWPGYGENSRVLKWIFDRVEGKANAAKTPIGFLPAPQDIDTTGLDVLADDMDAILSVDKDGWKAAIPQIRDHYAAFGAKLPGELVKALDALDAELANA